MMKSLILWVFTLLCSVKAFACDCSTPKPAIAFYYSEYVFEGIVASKTYASDSLTYTVTFDILKHYKHGDSPKQLSFTLKSEGKYQGEFTSCDWNVNKNEKWLIYAYRYQEKLVFVYMCGNSKPIGPTGIFQAEQQVLDNGNDFDPSKYIFTSFDWINTQPQSNAVDSLLKKYRYTKHTPNRVNIMVEIDEKGRLISAASTRKWYSLTDSVFGLYIPENRDFSQPTNQKEEYFLGIVRSLKKWNIISIPHSTTAIKYRRDLQFYY